MCLGFRIAVASPLTYVEGFLKQLSCLIEAAQPCGRSRQHDVREWHIVESACRTPELRSTLDHDIALCIVPVADQSKAIRPWHQHINYKCNGVLLAQGAGFGYPSSRLNGFAAQN